MLKRGRDFLAGLAVAGAATLGAHDGLVERGQNKPGVESKDVAPKDVNREIRDAVHGTFCVGKDFENALERSSAALRGDGEDLAMNTTPQMENVIRQNMGRQAEFNGIVDDSLARMEKEGRLIDVNKNSLRSITAEIEGNLIEAGFMPLD